MDSFCFPAAPCPSRKPFLEPSVPEASLLMNASQPNSYQAWRNNICNGEQSKKITSILKKQVRFDSPSVPSFKQVQTNCHTEMRPEIRQEKEMPQCPRNLSSQINTPPLNKVLKNRPFQEIYMANIPNRHLDLSLIDLNKPVCTTESNNIKHPNEVMNTNCTENITKSSTPPQKTPTTYREFLEMQKSLKEFEKTNDKYEVSNYITDIYNYASPRVGQKKRQAPEKIETEKLSNDKTEDLHIRTVNYCDDMDKCKIDPFPNSSSIRHVTGKENIWYNNGQIPISQLITPFEKSNKPFEADKDLQNSNFQMQKARQTCDNSVQTSIIEPTENACKHIEKTEIVEKSDEPTVKDLLKIIQQQNEQLLVLQKQVSSLLDFKEKQKCIEPNKQRVNDENKFIQQMQEHKDYLNSAGSTPRRGPLPKFSIDLMTSFEVSFRPQQNINQRRQREFVTQEPKIQEIVEADSDSASTNVESKRITDPSLYLQEPITVPENCPSPEPSINIDMKDYESSEDDEDCTSDIGASFYKKMMNQVNKIIQNAQRQATFDGKMAGIDDMRERTLSKVRDATIKQLKKINMNFSPIEEVSSSSCSDSIDSTTDQINLAVKQLLMKYLPDDQLTKLHLENDGVLNSKRSTDKIVLNARAPQFSFATVQFMKKYDLIADDGNVPKKLDVQEKAKSARMYKLQQNNPKILDISTLKQQPKLL